MTERGHTQHKAESGRTYNMTERGHTHHRAESGLAQHTEPLRRRKMSRKRGSRRTSGIFQKILEEEMDRHQDWCNVEKETKSQMRKMVVISSPSQRSGCLLTSVLGELVQKKSLDFRTGFRHYVLGFTYRKWYLCLGDCPVHRLGTRDSYVCAETRSADSKCTSSCNSHSDFQRFPEGNTMLQAYFEGVGADGAFVASRGTCDKCFWRFAFAGKRVFFASKGRSVFLSHWIFGKDV